MTKGFVTTLLCFALLFSGQSFGQANLEYALLDDYLAEHPQQRQLMNAFAAQVDQAATPLRKPLTRPVRIALLYPGNQASDYWRRSLAVFRSRLNDLGLSYELESYFTRPVIEQAQLEAKLTEALSHDPDYLVFTLDSPNHARIIERLMARSRPKLILQNITTPVSTWGERQPLIYIGFDHHLGTLKLTDAILHDQQNRPRNFSVLFWGRGYVSEMRGQSFIERVEQNGGRVLSSYYTEGNRESSRRAALDALSRNPEIEFIYASATDVAMGAIDALKERGLLGKIGINGWGGGEPELQAMDRDELDVTIMRINDENGIAMAEAIRNDLEGKPVPQVYSGAMEVLWKHEGKARRDELHRRAFSYKVMPE